MAENNQEPGNNAPPNAMPGPRNNMPNNAQRAPNAPNNAMPPPRNLMPNNAQRVPNAPNNAMPPPRNLMPNNAQRAPNAGGQVSNAELQDAIDCAQRITNVLQRIAANPPAQGGRRRTKGRRRTVKRKSK